LLVVWILTLREEQIVEENICTKTGGGKRRLGKTADTIKMIKSGIMKWAGL
jgi:hypothetical protein